MDRRAWIVIAALMALWPAWAFAQGAPGGETTPLRDVSDLALWSVIGGAITSLVTAFLARVAWPSDVKLGFFLALCCFTAGVNSYLNGDLNGATWLRSLMLVVASGWSTYLLTRPAMQKVSERTG